MAKQQIRQYVFTPGGSGVGNVKIPGRITLEEILLITNVTRNTILYNFADPSFAGTTATFTSGNDSNFPTISQREDGYTTITFFFNTSSQNSTDRLSILVEETEVLFRPFRFGTDAIERMRVSNPQSMIDADFEYGLQPTKWAGYGIIRGYPSVYEIPGVDLTITTMTTDGASPNSLITVTTVQSHSLSVGDAVSITSLNSGVSGSSRADGNFIVNSVSGVNTFNYYAWGPVGTNGQSLVTDATVLKRGGVYSGASLNVNTASGNGGNPATITITFNSNHGLVPGTPIFVTYTGGTNRAFASGPFYVEQTTNLQTIIYTANSGGAISSLSGCVIYAMSQAQVIHRPFDGGVLINNGSPAYGASVVRVSKQYFRYQSGKGLLWSTGTLLRPNYDVQSISANSTSVGATITIKTDDIAHGLQVGAFINLFGVSTSGYNNIYRVNGITDDYTFTVLSISNLGATTPVLDISCRIQLHAWHGSSIRTGPFDDQNGMFWEFDGQNLCVVRRNSTQQVTGTISINPNSNQVTGSNTRFTSQVRAGNKIVIRGMTHWVTYVQNDTTLFVNPDFRGTQGISGVKCSLVQETRIKQSDFNIDKVDGTGPSAFTIDTGRMHMLGIQYTWYGAGFIDYMVRGSDGNWVYAHRIKNNNVNLEAHMRSGNLPVRYSVENESAFSWLTADPGSGGTTLTIADNTYFANSGTVYIDNELIFYNGKGGTTQLQNCTRGTTLSYYQNGTNKTFSAGAAASHPINTGVIQISSLAQPTLSHWGSALICDGIFDNDRGYIFNYQVTDRTLALSTQTMFMIRLAPSVSNSTIGDLGIKDLLNRSQLLLSQCGVSLARPSSGGNIPNSVVIEGVLNPKNYSTASWQSLNLDFQGGQPSLAQVANTFTFSSGSYALPGEQVFAFVANPVGDANLDLNSLKELTNSPFGGVGAYPNGPDVLAINARISGGTGSPTVQAAVLLRWSEAQA